MIPAAEALQLPTAQLSADELIAAEKLEGEIEKYVRQSMKWQGCIYQTSENNEAVVVEVVRRLKVAGYAPQCQTVVEQHRLNAAKQVLVGFRIVVIPTDEAYHAATRAVLS